MENLTIAEKLTQKNFFVAKKIIGGLPDTQKGFKGVQKPKFLNRKEILKESKLIFNKKVIIPLNTYKTSMVNRKYILMANKFGVAITDFSRRDKIIVHRHNFNSEGGHLPFEIKLHPKTLFITYLEMEALSVGCLEDGSLFMVDMDGESNYQHAIFRDKSKVWMMNKFKNPLKYSFDILVYPSSKNSIVVVRYIDEVNTLQNSIQISIPSIKKFIQDIQINSEEYCTVIEKNGDCYLVNIDLEEVEESYRVEEKETENVSKQQYLQNSVVSEDGKYIALHFSLRNNFGNSFIKVMKFNENSLNKLTLYCSFEHQSKLEPQIQITSRLLPTPIIYVVNNEIASSTNSNKLLYTEFVCDSEQQDHYPFKRNNAMLDHTPFIYCYALNQRNKEVEKLFKKEISFEPNVTSMHVYDNGKLCLLGEGMLYQEFSIERNYDN